MTKKNKKRVPKEHQPHSVGALLPYGGAMPTGYCAVHEVKFKIEPCPLCEDNAHE